MPPQDSRSQPSGLGKQSVLTAGAAGLGLASGLLLDLVIAWKFGATGATDAYFAGIRVPLAIGTVLLVAANQAFVPTFSWWFAQSDHDRASRDASATVILSVLALTAATVLLILLAPLIIRLFAPGFGPEQQDTAITVLRVGSLTIPTVAGAEALRAFLNAQYAFVAPALMNVAYSGVAALVVLLYSDPSIITVAWALVIGGITRLAFLVVMAWTRGFRFHLPMRWKDETEVLTAMRRSLRPIATGSAAPISRLGDVFIASYLPTGSLSLLSYASRLVSALGGTVLFRSIMVALLPRLSARQAARDHEGAKRVTAAGVALMSLAAIPVTVVVVGLAQPVAHVLFARGSFTQTDAWTLGLILLVLGVSLPADGLSRVTLAPIISNLDTKTPLRNACIAVATNLTLLPLLTLPFAPSALAILGAAAAYTCGQYASSIHATLAFRGRYGLDAIRSQMRPIVLLITFGLAATLVWLSAYPPSGDYEVTAFVLAGTIVGALLLVAGVSVSWLVGFRNSIRLAGLQGKTRNGGDA